MSKWICVRLDDRRLWTADLYDGNVLIKNIGGSYPKANSVVFDAKRTWGINLEIKVIPSGPVNFAGEIEV